MEPGMHITTGEGRHPWLAGLSDGWWWGMKKYMKGVV